MGFELLTFVNPVAPPPTNPFLAIFFYILLTPIGVVLQFFDKVFESFGPTATIGAFGIAIIVLTLVIRGLLFPLFRWQIATQWRIQAEQRMVAPELKALQQKYKKDRQRLNEETMALYKRHGVNPLSQLSGCLPLLIQMPFIYALYGAIQKLSEGLHGHGGFLWVSQLSDVAFKVKGGVVAHPLLLIIPILAGVFTFMQSKMMMQPVRPDMSDSEKQMYRVMAQTTYLMPVLIAFFALNFAQGIGLYWITQSLVMVLQVFSMMGWGGLSVPSWFPRAGWHPPNSPRGLLTADATGGALVAPARRSDRDDASGGTTGAVGGPRPKRPGPTPDRPSSGQRDPIRPATSKGGGSRPKRRASGR
ncbi:MAG: YidC/Oxa1 family membrane protein insertase [Candidatus Dormibacteria bacterium]